MRALFTIILIFFLKNTFCQTSHTVVIAKNAQGVKRYLIKISNDEREKIIWYPALKGYHFCGGTQAQHLSQVPPGYKVSTTPAQCEGDPWIRVSILMNVDTLQSLLNNTSEQNLIYANSTLTVKGEDNTELNIPLNTEFAFLQSYVSKAHAPDYNPQYVASSGLSPIKFEFQNSELNSSNYPSLDYIASTLKTNPQAKVSIEGHTSGDEGDTATALNLARDRANSIKTYLVNSGISATRITIKAYGETKPLASESTEEGRISNRRVEINISN